MTGIAEASFSLGFSRNSKLEVKGVLLIIQWPKIKVRLSEKFLSDSSAGVRPSKLKLLKILATV